VGGVSGAGAEAGWIVATIDVPEPPDPLTRRVELSDGLADEVMSLITPRITGVFFEGFAHDLDLALADPPFGITAD
jgi:hypothetical protein